MNGHFVPLQMDALTIPLLQYFLRLTDPNTKTQKKHRFLRKQEGTALIAKKKVKIQIAPKF